MNAKRAKPAWLLRFRQDKAAPYLFIAPFFILFIIFFLGPSLYAIILSLHRWNGVGEMSWRGTWNFETLMDDEVFWQALENTAIYMLASVFWVCSIALLLALALNSKQVRFKPILRSMYFSPVVTSTIAISTVFVLIYNRDYGILNAPLRAMDLTPIDWLGDRGMVKLAIIGLITWRWTGYVMMYFLAGLQTIPQELYEAAWIDGANSRQAFFHITLPMLRPVILYVMVVVSIGSAQIFEEPYILTEGGPANASLSIAEYIYTRAFNRLHFGYAAAMGLILFVGVFVLSAIQFRVLGRSREN